MNSVGTEMLIQDIYMVMYLIIILGLIIGSFHLQEA